MGQQGSFEPCPQAPQLTSALSRYRWLLLLREANLLFWESFCWTRSKLSLSTILGTETGIHSSSGRRLAVVPAPTGASGDLLAFDGTR